MPEHYHYDEGDLVNAETRHETSDVNVRALIWFGVITVIFAVITHFLVFFLYRAFIAEEVHRDKVAGVMTEVRQPGDAAVPKNQPLLQPFPRKMENGQIEAPYRNTPVTDLAAMRDGEQRALSSYGWVDPQKGVVRMPIEEAIRLTVQRGLPLQAQMPAPITTTPRPSDATGGQGAQVVRQREGRP